MPMNLQHIVKRTRQFCRFVGDNNPDKLPEVGNPLRRKMLAVAMGTKILPFIFGRYIHHKYYAPIEKHGLKVIGQGYHSIAALDPKNGTVMKFHYRYADHTAEEEMQQLIDDFEHRQEKLTSTLGEIAVSQTYDIDQSPYDPSMPMIIARQKFIPAKQIVRLDTMALTDSLNLPDIKDFLSGNIAMIDDHAAVADLFGRGNVVVSEQNEKPALRMVDPIPLIAEESSQTRYDEAVGIIDKLSQNL